MRLILYPTGDVRPTVRAAPAARDWMDATPQSYAYRCLPLNIANAHGWEVLSPSTFEVRWNGGPSKEDLAVTPLAGTFLPTSHFGSGILTFHPGYLMRTEPGHNLWVTGPVNRPKDGIAPLSGVVETDWAPYTFTMNWVMTRRNTTVRFEAGEPFCFFFPVVRGMVESVEPELRDLEEDPETLKHYRDWSASRRTFNEELKEPESAARKQKWQKKYYLGERPDGEAGDAEHQIKLHVKEIADKRASKKNK
ncbi:MAG: DUF6065 family protein [Rhodospirillales bacterium]